ncbi:MAG: hypothetical protein DHS20C14_11380 [Phycisphaeraceae bacterium]|nr:MAG: hypothetical protein DHS20C14_11380 [Phycisphaeraceae bacterium]
MPKSLENNAAPPVPLEVRITESGEALLAGLSGVLRQVPSADAGPQRLATALGVDKVLASRLLKAVRGGDAMSVLHRAPGPEPLRRVLRACSKAGVEPDALAEAHAAVDLFESLIRSEVGDRSGLEAILSAWIPEARRDFELRRKQAAFRAMSQLKGMHADAFAEAAIFWPSDDGERVDVVWLKAVIGLRCLRPGAVVRFTSQRSIEDAAGRRPRTLEGEPVESVANTVVPEFCSSPTPELTGNVVGEMTHYTLDRVSLGQSADVVTCEVNRAEIARYLPASRGRRAWASSDTAICSRVLQLDVLVHPDVFPGERPDLRIYDSAIRGTADRNDPSRDIDQLDLLESIDELGVGIDRFGSSHVPRYRSLLRHTCECLGYDGDLLRGYRVSSDYPVYGSQYAMSFRTTEPPA